MGEVYQALDTKFDRDVALKVLPEAFTEFQPPDLATVLERSHGEGNHSPAGMSAEIERSARKGGE